MKKATGSFRQEADLVVATSVITCNSSRPVLALQCPCARLIGFILTGQGDQVRGYQAGVILLPADVP
jgi:hypothetical protein